MAGLPYLPKSVADTTESWGWTSTVQSALGSIKEQGEAIMAPIGQQLASAMPQPAPFQMPEDVGAADGRATQWKLPEIQPFTLPDLSAWGFGQSAAQPTPAPPQQDQGFELSAGATPDATVRRRQPAATSGGFSLPGPEAWGMGSSTAQPAPTGRTAGPAAAPSGAPAPSDVNGYLEHAARKAGIDPAQVLAVMGKEGPTGWGSVGTFDTGTSYGPLQLHYAGGSNPKEGMGDRFTRATGIDLRKDSSVQAHQAAVDFALGELAKRGDWSEWYGADNAFPAASGGQGRFTKVNRVQPTQQPAAEVAPTGAPKLGTYTPETLSPNQFTEGQAQGLSAEEALAVCGPAAAVAFARANGRNPTLREAKELAQNLGLWDQGQGMHGPASQVQLLEKMGVQASLQPGTDWTRVAQEVQAGRPVIIDTPNHYFTVSGYDPQTGQFEFGQSAGVLKASKGRTRFRPDEIPGLGMGAPRATIYLGGQR